MNLLIYVLGFKVKLLLRDPSKLPEEYAGKVEIIEGNVINYDDVKKALEGVDSAVVVLGTRNNLGKV